VDRGLLRRADAYGQLDVIEQAVVKALLAALPKSHVTLVWHEIRPELRNFVADADVSLVWDPQPRRAVVTRTATDLQAEVRHGRPIYVLPLGHLVIQAREAYRAEMRAAKREASRDEGHLRPGQSDSMNAAP
jgi:hypothetical protein